MIMITDFLKLPTTGCSLTSTEAPVSRGGMVVIKVIRESKSHEVKESSYQRVMESKSQKDEESPKLS